MYYKLNTCPLLPLDLITTSHPTIVSLSFSHDDKFQEHRNWGTGPRQGHRDTREWKLEITQRHEQDFKINSQYFLTFLKLTISVTSVYQGITISLTQQLWVQSQKEGTGILTYTKTETRNSSNFDRKQQGENPLFALHFVAPMYLHTGE